MSEPKDFLGNELLSTFGMREFECAIADIIKFLASDEKFQVYPGQEGYDVDTGWGKLFRINTIPKLDSDLFAMLCAAGWIENNYFPKYTFRLSKAAIKRLEESICKHPKVISYTAGDPYEECVDCGGYRVLRKGLWQHKGGVIQVKQPNNQGRMTETWETAGPMKFQIQKP